ncbi:TIGR01906 family membrane protein [Persephonella sp.]
MKRFILTLGVFLSIIWIIGVSTRIVFAEWFINYEYSKKDFPKDRWKMPDEVRIELAKIGLYAVLSDEGLERFKEAKLPNGNKAFKEKEIKHIEDVNNFLDIFFPLTFISLAVWFFFYLILKDQRWKLLFYSGMFTVAFIVVGGILIYFNYNFAFTVFHDFVFGEDTWRFRQKDTLLRIYPMKFWFDGTFFVIGFSLLFSSVLISTGLLIKKLYQD